MFNLDSASLCPLRRHTQNITRGRFWEEQLKLVSRNWNRVHWKQSIGSCLFPLGNETGSSVKLSVLHSVRRQARVDDWSYHPGNSETEAGGSQVVSLPGLQSESEVSLGSWVLLISKLKRSQGSPVIALECFCPRYCWTVLVHHSLRPFTVAVSKQQQSNAIHLLQLLNWQVFFSLQIFLD